MKLVADTWKNRDGIPFISEYSIKREKTLRDEFAMAVLQGFLANGYIYQERNDLTEDCYKLADAMLITRKRKLDE